METKDRTIDPHNPAHLAAIVSIWNAACGDDLAINARFAAYNLRPSTGAVQAGQIAMASGGPVAFVLAAALPNDPRTSPPEVGWIDAIAVVPEYQRHGIGGKLLAWAEDFLRGHDCTRFRLGGGLHPFAPGLPAELGTERFFMTRGYAPRAGAGTIWDVARDLSGYPAAEPPGRAMQPGDESALLEFFNREFPGRWRFEFEEFLREQGRRSDYVLLWTEHGMGGFARVTLEDSERPVERFYMRRLSRPWGQLGPIGVRKDARGKGYGTALMHAALSHLRSRGVRGCVIDWTDLPDFYAKFGFAPFREYRMLVKTTDNC